jgi:hypothetical protein
MGELNLIAIEASVDYRVGTRDGAPIAEFSWEGDDDGRPISGRGWARRTARAWSAACSFTEVTRPSSLRSAFGKVSRFVHTQTGVYHTHHGKEAIQT